MAQDGTTGPNNFHAENSRNDHDPVWTNGTSVCSNSASYCNQKIKKGLPEYSTVFVLSACNLSINVWFGVISCGALQAIRRAQILTTTLRLRSLWQNYY